MKKFIIISLIFLCNISLSGCVMNNREGGTLAGGAAGALLGSTIGHGGGQMFAIVAGTLAGAFIGSAVGQSMDDTDRLKMSRALDQNSVGQPAYWRNSHSDTSYEVVPVRNVSVGNNQYCREYRTVAMVGGQKQQVYGTACRQPDGSWQANNK